MCPFWLLLLQGGGHHPEQKAGEWGLFTKMFLTWISKVGAVHSVGKGDERLHYPSSLMSKLSVVLTHESAGAQSPPAVLLVKQDQLTFRWTHPSVCSTALQAGTAAVNKQLI